MGMFGSGFRGGIDFAQVEPTIQPPAYAAPVVQAPSAAAYAPPKRTFLDKLGLVADAFTGEQANASALAQKDVQAFALWRAEQDAQQDAVRLAATARTRAPHYWETNDGSLGVIGPDGQPQILYKDPTPKVDYTPVKNADGTTTLYPTVNGQLVGGGGRRAPAGPPTGVTFTPLPAQGGAGSGPRTFR